MVYKLRISKGIAYDTKSICNSFYYNYSLMGCYILPKMQQTREVITGHSTAYPRSIFVVQVSANFNFTNIRSDLKRIANIAACNGIRKAIFCNKNSGTFQSSISAHNRAENSVHNTL